jgi:hypothetical protein
MFSQAIDRYGLDHETGMLMHGGIREEDDDESDDEIDKLISKLKPSVGNNGSFEKEEQSVESTSAGGIGGVLDYQSSRSDSSNSDAENAGEDSDNSSDDGEVGDGDQENVAKSEAKSEKLTVYERKMLKKLKLKGTAADIKFVKEKNAEKLAAKSIVSVKATSQSAAGPVSDVKQKAKK